MRCPKCGDQEDKVIDSRASKEGATIRRRRECLACQHRFTTYEVIEQKKLFVVKRDATREEFSKNKLMNGIKRACEKRPISPQKIEELVEHIQNELTDRFDSEVPVSEIGMHVMDGLRQLDAVAYVRYASVYRRFAEADDFIETLKKLDTRHDTATIRLPGI